MTYSIIALDEGSALRAGLGLWLVVVLASGCVAEKPLGAGQSCPCAPGWSCNQLQRCVQAGDADRGADAGLPRDGADAVEGPLDAAGDNAGCSEVSYPASGFYGKNVFALDATSFVSDYSIFPNYEVTADLAPGATVTVKITMLPDTLATFQATRTDSGPSSVWPLRPSIWYINDGEGWLVSFFDEARGEQVFQSQIGVRRPEKRLFFDGTGQARVDYFECGSAIPTRTKIISWAPDGDAGVDPPQPLDAASGGGWPFFDASNDPPASDAGAGS